MGYHVCITRQEFAKEIEIPRKEWLDFVSKSDEWSFDQTDDEFTQSISCAVWNKDNELWLGWSHGEIWTKNPSNKLIQKMIQIAPQFKARVRGDEGEYYNNLEDYYYEEEGKQISRKEKEEQLNKSMQIIKTKRLIWNIIRIILLIFVFFIIIKRLGTL